MKHCKDKNLRPAQKSTENFSKSRSQKFSTRLDRKKNNFERTEDGPTKQLPNQTSINIGHLGGEILGDFANAIAKHGVGLKRAAITPNANRVKELRTQVLEMAHHAKRTVSTTN